MVRAGDSAVDLFNEAAARAKSTVMQERLYKAAKFLYLLERRFKVRFIAVDTRSTDIDEHFTNKDK